MVVKHKSKPGLLHLREGEAIVEALNQSGGNHSKAARILGISRDGLRGKIKRLKLRLRVYLKSE
jgi:DNA-binding NtrC family response regulator